MAYRNLVAAGLVSLALTTTASAADLGQIPMRGGPQVTEFFSMWYLRVDGGYRFNSISNGVFPSGESSGSTLADAGTIGGGLGYKYNWFRADITVDYGAQPKYSSNTPIPGQVVTASLATYTALFNGYIDFGTWYGFTPYLGAGIGYSNVKPSDFNNANAILFPSTISGDGRWTPSWAVMAGVSYLFSPVWLLDISYRYLDVGKATSTLWDGTTVQYGDWTAQEIRVGLRYLIP